MRQLLFSCSLVILVAALTVACSQSLSSPSAISSPPSAAHIAAQLDGAWTLSAIQPASGTKQDRPMSSTYTLTFAEGRLSTRADCNMCSGAFSLSGNTLTAGPKLACTRAACATAAFESAYSSMLSGDSQMVVTGSTLTLTSPRGVLYFVRN